jgi:hypothetical protein
MTLVLLREIKEVKRSELRPYCFEIVTQDRTYYLSFKGDDGNLPGIGLFMTNFCA